MSNLAVLDLPRVREVLAALCRTPVGKELARAMEPSRNREWIESELDCLDELLALGELPDVAAVPDVRPLLQRAGQGSVLRGTELLEVARAAAGTSQCRADFGSRRERLVLVWHSLRALEDHSGLADRLEGAIDEHGEVADDATPRLAGIRAELRQHRNSLVSRMEKLVADHPDWFQDRPTVRRDRFVLPLRLDHRDRVPGVVHESSGSGQTLFVEPIETLAEQNRVAELRGEETEEVARVLRELSGAVAERAESLRVALEIVGRADFLVAKCRLARDLGCRRPGFSTGGELRLLVARHPLLVRRGIEVVPLDLDLPEGRRVVLVSGPNAGGKTVVLKTVGLLALMAACGMQVPAAEGTVLPLFDGVFADIGDDQSLDADLSSFTAHLENLKSVLRDARPGALVLLDEIGSSTSPEEGTALAFAVLEELRDRGVLVVATSHFGSLKLLVQDEPGMVNAAMGFRDGRPNYRLDLGHPGESSAFATAERVGLPARLVERARQRMSGEWLDLDARFRALDRELEEARRERETAEREHQQAVASRAELESQRAAFEQEAVEERERLRQERERFLVATRREIENAVRQIRQTQAEHRSIVDAKRLVERELADASPPAGAEPGPPADFEPKPGDLVLSRTFRRAGEVVGTGPGKVTVAFGSVRTELPLADIGPAGGERPVAAREPETRDEPYHFSPNLNIVGMRREEAFEALTGFLDEASALEVGEVTIVHGRGGGVLRQMVWDCLGRDRRVSDFAFGGPAEGGSGVTRARLGSDDDPA